MEKRRPRYTVRRHVRAVALTRYTAQHAHSRQPPLRTYLYPERGGGTRRPPPSRPSPERRTRARAHWHSRGACSRPRGTTPPHAASPRAAFDAAAEAEADELRGGHNLSCGASRSGAAQKPDRRAQPAAVRGGWARGKCDCVARARPHWPAAPRAGACFSRHLLARHLRAEPRVRVAWHQRSCGEKKKNRAGRASSCTTRRTRANRPLARWRARASRRQPSRPTTRGRPAAWQRPRGGRAGRRGRSGGQGRPPPCASGPPGRPGGRVPHL